MKSDRHDRNPDSLSGHDLQAPHALPARCGRLLARHPLRGPIFESFAVSDRIKSFSAIREDAPPFCWRDATGHEIDILVDLASGSDTHVVPIEVKSGGTVASDAVDTLAWWTAIPGNPARGGVLVHGGTESFEFRGFRILPWYLQ